MILTLANWIYIMTTALLLGIGVTGIAEKCTGYRCEETDVTLFLGVAAATAYAQIFSLFAKVGMAANVLLVVICLLTAAVCRKRIQAMLLRWRERLLARVRNRDAWFYAQAAMLLLFFCFFVVIALQRAYHADTDGYHAQSIRWIEDYGAVKGLGNLYHRLAYNSAFMSFQALFSWKFLIGQSMHVGNACLCLMAGLYALCTLSCFRGGRARGSDLFRLMILMYLCRDTIVAVLSSPNTDNFVLVLILYLLVKWCEYNENGRKEPEAYGYLCVLCLFGLTLKLSVAVMVLLTAKPAFEMIRQKKWQSIATYLAMGFLVLLPFCARNVIVSGYLFYPYAAVDLFDVDWKMLPYMADFEQKEIMYYAKALDQAAWRDAPVGILQWFPRWWSGQEMWFQALFALNILLLPVWFYLYLSKWRKKANVYDNLLGAVLLCQLLYWMLTAPSVRFGSIFLFFLPCMTAAYWIEDRRPALKIPILALGGAFLCLFAIHVVKYTERLPLKRSSYYVMRECYEVPWETGRTGAAATMNICLPVENGYTGYYYPLATQMESILQYIELRGDDVRDGFKIKDEYRDAQIDTYGRNNGE